MRVKAEPPLSGRGAEASIPTGDWAVEVSVGRRAVGGGVVVVFAETEGGDEHQCFLPGTGFRKLDGTAMMIDNVKEGDTVEGPGGEVTVEEVREIAAALRMLIDIDVMVQPGLLQRISVTDDHRMRLQRGVYRAASKLCTSDLLSTFMGDFPVFGLSCRPEVTSVFEVKFGGDRSVFMTFGPAHALVATFGAPHVMNDYVEFKLKGAISSRNVAEPEDTCHNRFRELLPKFDLQFLDTAPYSVWVRRSCANDFFEAVKQLKNEMPRGSRLRRHDPDAVCFKRLVASGFSNVTESDLLRASPTHYED